MAIPLLKLSDGHRDGLVLRMSRRNNNPHQPDMMRATIAAGHFLVEAHLERGPRGCAAVQVGLRDNTSQFSIGGKHGKAAHVMAGHGRSGRFATIPRSTFVLEQSS
nr:hypothetical protein [Sinorhizobium meliloti]